jgi:preprotein translocase subunit YajC
MFFISDALAQEGAPPPGGGLSMIFFMVVIFALFYFMLIRPQQKRAKEHKAMVDTLEKGNEVVTTGGILGRITKLDDNFVTLDVGAGTEIRVQRHAVHQVMPKGTMRKA